MLQYAIIKLLRRIFKDDMVRLVAMTEQKENAIVRRMAEIEGMKDFLELHRQAAFQLYAKTDDKQYRGYATFADTILKRIDELTKKEIEEEPRGGGYDSTA
jgi:hypothetical protein